MSKQKLNHKLKTRHLQMIALGGVIGTGLFFGSAKSIHLTGPSIVLSYILGGLLVYIIMRALGELTVFSPSSGSFSDYASRFVGNYAGFISGWSAWFEYTVVCMVELSAVPIFVDYIFPGIPHWLLCLVILVAFTFINLMSIKLFGEFEFWFAGIKIVAILAMILFTAYLIVFKHQLNPELSHYSNPSLFFAGGLNGFMVSLVIVVFSFGGSEFVSIAAGEAENPKKTVPQAINGVILRILLFYVLTMLAIVLIYPYDKLSQNISPFVDVFKQIGLSSAAMVMNIVAITAALSSFNSCLYSASRMLFSLSTHRNAPKVFSQISNETKIPKVAILFSSLCVVIAVIVNFIFPDKAIMYLMTIAVGSIIIVWFMILITQIYFRKYSVSNNVALEYRLTLFPYSNLIAMAGLILILGVMTQMNDMRLSVYVAPLWILALSVVYALKKRKAESS